MNPGATVEEALSPTGPEVPDDDRLLETRTEQEAKEDGLDAVYHFLKRQLAEQPLTVLVVALGAGLLLGAVLGDRR
jgi:hypothetical protein